MANTINLLPVRSKDQIKKEITRYKYDLYTALLILAFVVGGIICMFINAFVKFNINNVEQYIRTGQSTLQTYKTLAQGYYLVDRKAGQIHLIKKQKINPADVISYIGNLIPPGTALSNFSFRTDDTFDVTISSANYVDIAKFLVVLEDPSLRVKNTDIKEIDYNHDQNVLNFIISGKYQHG